MKRLLCITLLILSFSANSAMHFYCQEGQEVKVKTSPNVFKAKINFQVTEYGVFLNFDGEPSYTFPPFSSDGVTLATQDDSGTIISMRANGMDTTFIVYNTKEQIQYVYTKCGNGVLK